MHNCLTLPLSLDSATPEAKIPSVCWTRCYHIRTFAEHALCVTQQHQSEAEMFLPECWDNMTVQWFRWLLFFTPPKIKDWCKSWFGTRRITFIWKHTVKFPNIIIMLCMNPLQQVGSFGDFKMVFALYSSETSCHSALACFSKETDLITLNML